jgi:hypothetical protein
LLILTGISGCLAYLDPQFVIDETEHTIQFFDAQIQALGGSTFVLSTIRTILDSVWTYHLDAEIALQSIDGTMKGHIEEQYAVLIHTIDHWLKVQSQQVAVDGEVEVFNEQDLVANLFQAILNWASKYQGMLDSNVWTSESYRVEVERYVHQKLFVVMYQASISAPTTTVKSQLVLSAATSMSKLDMGRICVCEGIMLSVFLKNPYTLPDPLNQWRMADIKQRLDFQSMWDHFGLDKETRRRITRYTQDTVLPESLVAGDRPASDLDNTVVPDTVPALDMAQSHIVYVYSNFAQEMRRFHHILRDDIGMEPKHRQRFVKWIQRVWARLCKPITEEEAAYKSTVDRNINESIKRIKYPIKSSSGSDAGPSSKN